MLRGFLCTKGQRPEVQLEGNRGKGLVWDMMLAVVGLPAMPMLGKGLVWDMVLGVAGLPAVPMLGPGPGGHQAELRHPALSAQPPPLSCWAAAI